MAPRQVWLFQLGCWMALAAAALHVVAHFAGTWPTDPHIVAGLSELAPAAVFTVPGLRQPTFISVFEGFSVGIAILLATIGAAGLAVQRHSNAAPLAVRGMARAFAAGTALLLVTSIVGFFSAQTFVISVVAMCFALASVDPEG